MKRLLGALICGAMIGAAYAQAPFTVVSPRNYNPDTNQPLSRENLVLKFPKKSIPTGGYIGVFMGATRGDKVESEKFVEATVPTLKGDYYYYTLDTKARQIPDGMYTIRAVLYVDYSDRPREISQTQVNVRVANKSSITIPEKGLSLHYGFKAGQELSYRLDIRTAISTISSKANSLGGRAAELPLDSQVLRMLYAVDDVYSNGDGLIRMQPLPLRGKDFVWVITEGNDTPDKYYTYEMAPVYMRMSNTGRQIYGTIPETINSTEFVPLAGSQERVNLYANFPLPSLPDTPRKPGDRWETRFLMPRHVDLENRATNDSIATSIPARGEFLDVEYEQGHPCARLRNSISEGTKTPEGMKLTQQGRDFSDDKIALTETIWYALDTKKVIKIVRDITIDTKEQAQGLGIGSGGAGGGGGAAAPTGPGGKPRLTPSGNGGNTGGKGSAVTGPDNGYGALNFFQKFGGGGQGPGRPGAPPPPGSGGPSNPTGPGGFGGRGSTGAPPTADAQYYRYSYQLIFTLEN